MSTVFVGANKSFTAADSDLNIFGGSGVETVRVIDGVTNTGIDAGVNANVEGVDFARAVSAYTFQVTGNLVVVRLSGTIVVSVVVQDDANGTRLRFDNGGADLRITGLNQVTLGGVAVSTAAGGAAITPAQMGASFNAADVAPGLPPDGGTVPPPPPPPSADTVELTVFPDIFTSQNLPGKDGGPASTFNAPRVFTPGGTDQQNSLNDDDILEGKNADASKNTLNVDFVNDADTGDTDIVPTLINIGVINTKFIGDGSLNLDLQDASNLKAINVLRVDDDAATVQHSNIGNVPGDLSVQNSSALAVNVQFNFTDLAVSGADDKTNVLLNNALVNTLTIQEGPTSVPPIDEGIETQSFTSSGGGNVIGSTFVAEDLRVLNLAGGADLTINTGTPVLLAGNFGNPTEAELVVSGPSFTNTAGSFSALDAIRDGFSGDLDANLGPDIGAVRDGTSGTPVAFVFKGGSGDDILRVGLSPAGGEGAPIGGFLGAEDIVTGFTNGVGGDTLDVFTTASNSKLIDGNITGFEHYSNRYQGKLGGQTLVSDVSLIGGLQDITVRNEAANTTAGLAVAAVNTRFTLDHVAGGVVGSITLKHGTTLNNNVKSTVLEVDLKDASGTDDVVKIRITDAINNEPIFNLKLDFDGLKGGLEDNGAVENVVIHDLDSESNAFFLDRIAEHTGLMVLFGGKANQNFSSFSKTFETSDARGSNGIENITNAPQLRQVLDQQLQFATVDARGQSSNVNVVLAKANAAQVFFGGAGNDTVDFRNTFNENDGSFAAPNDGGAGTDRLSFILTADQKDPIHAINFEILHVGATPGSAVLDTDDTSGLSTIELMSSVEASDLTGGLLLISGQTLTVENKTGATNLVYSGRGDIDADAKFFSTKFNALTLVDDEQTKASAFTGASDTQTAIFDNRDPYALANNSLVTAGGDSTSAPTSFEFVDGSKAGTKIGNGIQRIYDAGMLTVNGLENFVLDSRVSTADNGDGTVGDSIVVAIRGISSDTLQTIKVGTPSANKAGLAFETDVSLGGSLFGGVVQGNAANNSITLVDGNAVTGRFLGVFNSVGNGGVVTATGDGRDSPFAFVDLANTLASGSMDGFGDDLLVTTAQTPNVAIFEGHDIDLGLSNGTNIKITTGGGADRIVASQQADQINAGNGDNFVNARGGNDVVSTGSDDDFVNGGGDDDQIFTGRGNDILRGGTGQDNQQGGDGNDIFVVVGSIDAAQAASYAAAGADKLLGTTVGNKFIDVDGDASYKGGIDIATLNADGAQLVSFAELTNVTSATDTDPGETYNAGDTDLNDGLVVYGKASFVGSQITGVENLKLFSDVSVTESQYNGFTRIRGDGTSILRIVDDGGSVTAAQLVGTGIAGIGRLDLSTNVTMTIDPTQMGELITEGFDVLSGLGLFVGGPYDMQGRVVSNELVAANPPGTFTNFTAGFSNAQIETLGIGGLQVVTIAEGLAQSFPAGSFINVVDTEAKFNAILPAQIAQLVANNANDAFNIEPTDFAFLNVAQANAFGLSGSKFAADDEINVVDLAANYVAANFANIAKISPNRIVVGAFDVGMKINVAQATDVQNSTNLLFFPAETITILGDDQALLGLNLDRLAGSQVDLLDDNVDGVFRMTIAQADALRVADGPFVGFFGDLKVIGTDSVVITGTGAQLAALTPANYNQAALGGQPVTTFDATDDKVFVTPAQLLAFSAAGIKFAATDDVVVKDSGAALTAASGNATALKNAGADRLDASDNAVTLSVLQAFDFADEALKFAADDKITILDDDDSGASILGNLGTLKNSVLGGAAPVVLDSTDDVVIPDTATALQVFANQQVFALNDTVSISGDNSPTILGAGVGNLTKFDAVNVDFLNAQNNLPVMTIEQADAIRNFKLPFVPEDMITITGSGAVLGALTFADYEDDDIGGNHSSTATAAILDATDNTVTLTLAQAAALKAAFLKFAADDVIVITDTGANLANATFANLKTSVLGGASVTLNAVDDAVTLNIAQLNALTPSTGLKFAASDVITIKDTNAALNGAGNFGEMSTASIGGQKVQIDAFNAGEEEAVIDVSEAATIFTGGASFVVGQPVKISDSEANIVNAILGSAPNWKAIGVDTLHDADSILSVSTDQALTLFANTIRVADSVFLIISGPDADLLNVANHNKFDVVSGPLFGTLFDDVDFVLNPTIAQAQSVAANNLVFGVLDVVTVKDTIANADFTNGPEGFIFVDAVDVKGANGTQTFVGSTGNDLIAGGDGADVINGGLGSDKISGGLGADTITTGPNAGGVAEEISYANKMEGGDIITDFISGAPAGTGDKLHLSQIGFQVVNVQAFEFQALAANFSAGKNILVTGQAFAGIGDADTAIAGSGADQTFGFYLFFNTITNAGAGAVQLIHDTDLSGAGTQTLIAELPGTAINDFISGNFVFT